YYQNSGAEADEEIRIDMPKGGYAPLFAWPAQTISSRSGPRLAVLPFEAHSPSAESAMYGQAVNSSIAGPNSQVSTACRSLPQVLSPAHCRRPSPNPASHT